MIYIYPFFFTLGSECVNICMTWKYRHRQLIINCKIERLHFEVSIFGPSSDLQAHCLSPTHNISCTSFNNDGHVEQILQTNTTVYTIYDTDISRLNGIWRCQHGSRKDEISTEVTITKGKSLVYASSVSFYYSVSMILQT